MCSSYHSCAGRKKESGKRILLVYGGGSIRKNGIYDEAVLKVWGLSGDDDLAVGAAAIEKTAEFFYDVMELPKTLTEVGITGEHFKEMAAHSAPALKNAFVPLTADDVEKILTACL